jgi:hypothetical protein
VSDQPNEATVLELCILKASPEALQLGAKRLTVALQQRPESEYTHCVAF